VSKTKPLPVYDEDTIEEGKAHQFEGGVWFGYDPISRKALRAYHANRNPDKITDPRIEAGKWYVIVDGAPVEHRKDYKRCPKPEAT